MSIYRFFQNHSFIFILCLAAGCSSVLNNPAPSVQTPQAADSQTSELGEVIEVSSYLDGSSAGDLLQFSGYNWRLKQSEQLAGPGPNYWSPKDGNVWVDAKGRLHLKITNRDGKWYCPEIICTDSATYGTYAIELEGPIDKLDPRVVFGFFTWDDTAFIEQANCEIDIEISRWNDPKAQNLHYSVQPTFGSEEPSGRYRERTYLHHMKLRQPNSTHLFTWRPDSIMFSSYEGDVHQGHLLGAWSYTIKNPMRRTEAQGKRTNPIGIPKPGPKTHLRLNLWLIDINNDGVADAPAYGEEVEVVIKKITITPI